MAFASMVLVGNLDVQAQLPHEKYGDLFEMLPGRSPGDYTKLRATAVNRNSVGRVARRIEIAPLIRLGKGEEAGGGRKRLALLADCMEAVIGAVYLEAGWPAARDLVMRAFAPELEELRAKSRDQAAMINRLQKRQSEPAADAAVDAQKDAEIAALKSELAKAEGARRDVLRRLETEGDAPDVDAVTVDRPLGILVQIAS